MQLTQKSEFRIRNPKVVLFLVWALLPMTATAQDTTSQNKPQRVQIICSDKMSTIDMDSTSMTVLVGNVVLEHNRVVMSCDSAEWFPSGIFNSFGNVVVTSAAAQVTGDQMEYNGNTSMAKVRGKVVYLKDSASTLRTSGIDFNTKDEICFFENEGTIKDTAQLLESKQGYYYSKRKEFEFIGLVQSETNDYLLQSDSMMYNTETKLFTFYSNTHIRTKDRDGYLYCDRGRYDSENDKLFFISNSYIMSKTQEVFADSIYYENKSGKGKLYSNVQVVDTVQKIIALSDFADFDMNTQDFVLRKNPSILIYDENNDTVFMRADTLLSFNVPIAGTQAEKPDPLEKNAAKEQPSTPSPNGAVPKRSALGGLKIDGIKTIASPAEPDTTLKRNIVAATTDTVSPPSDFPQFDRSDSASIHIDYDSSRMASVQKPIVDSASIHNIDYDSSKIASVQKPIVDSASIHIDYDSSGMAPVQKPIADSASTEQTTDSIRADSIYRKIFGIGNVKIFRHDFQAKCDSAYFNTLDSIWKMHKSPVIWDSVKMQLCSDSVRIYVENGSPERAEFESNAMVVIPEGNPDSTAYFNQIKGRNMVARFENKEIKSLNVMGNAHTIFFSISDMMMNDTEAASMKINFESRKIRRVVYYVEVKGANSPLFLVPEENTKLTGFAWLGHLRPKSKDEVLGRALRMSVRIDKESLTKPDFPITQRIDKIERELKTNAESPIRQGKQ